MALAAGRDERPSEAGDEKVALIDPHEASTDHPGWPVLTLRAVRPVRERNDSNG